MAFLTLPELPACTPERLRAAVRAVIDRQAADAAAPSLGPTALTGRLPPSVRLEKGAEALAEERPEHAEATRFITAILEASYLVAASDGLAEQERTALAELVGHATGTTARGERLEALFGRFASLLAAEGLEARLDAVAAQLEDFVEREEVMTFAVLIAVADNELAPKEAVALIALGKRFGFSQGEVQAMVDAVAAELGRALRHGNVLARPPGLT